MQGKYILGRRTRRRFLIAAIALSCALAWTGAAGNADSQLAAVQTAQSEPQARVGQTGAPQTIVLPKILIAGEKATLAVVDAAGRLVPAVDIDLSSGVKVTTDDTGRAIFQAPTQTGIFTAHITETAQDFTTTVLAVPSNTGKTPRKKNADVSPGGSTLQPIAPRRIALQTSFDILGSGFSGEAYLDSVVLGDLPALVLAASPVALVAQPNPLTSTGQSELAAGLTGGQIGFQPVLIVSLQILGPEKPLSPGDASAVTVRASGTTERLALEVRSLTPGVVNLSRGDTEYWFTSGGAANAAKIKVHVVKEGNYSLSARLAAIDAPNIETARQQLLAARQFADAQWQKELDRLIQEMEHARDHAKEADAQHAARFRQEIERLLRNKPQDPMAGLLRAAWQSLGLESD